MVRFSPPPSNTMRLMARSQLAFRVRGAAADATRYFDSNSKELVSGDYARDPNYGLLNCQKRSRSSACGASRRTRSTM